MQKSCQSLTSHGFQEVTTLECLVRNFSVRKFSLPVADLGQVGSREDQQNQRGVKHRKTDNRSVETETSSSAMAQEDSDDVTESESASNKCRSGREDGFSFTAGVPPINTQGHTGFLTFATLYPA